jgi:two-component system response regulator AtoC
MKLLIIDDEKLLRNSLRKHFSREGYQVAVAETAHKGMQLFREYLPEVTLLDMRLPDGNGLQVLSQIREINPDAVVIMITAYGGITSAVQAIKNGAQDYITKPFDIDEMTFAVRKACEFLKMKRELRALKESTARKYHFGKIITQDPAVIEACNAARKVAMTDRSTVVVRGESGTGKELLCRAIHYESERRDQPLVVINCASLPENLLESELFGYEKGAFSGATKRKIGLLETADKGTAFLDEIGELSPVTQVKLLRFLQDQQFYRVGGTTALQMNVRVIAATNRDLEKALAEGRFREDLYYRLHVFPIFIPPLRDRRGDVPLLAQHMLEDFNSEFGTNIKGFSREAMNALQNYSWKGNVRELRNVIERAIILANDHWILASNLPAEVRQSVSPDLKRDDDFQLPLSEESIIPLDTLEVRYIQKVLELTSGNKSDACRRLGITRQRLRRKLYTPSSEG